MYTKDVMCNMITLKCIWLCTYTCNHTKVTHQRVLFEIWSTLVALAETFIHTKKMDNAEHKQQLQHVLSQGPSCCHRVPPRALTGSLHVLPHGLPLRKPASRTGSNRCSLSETQSLEIAGSAGLQSGGRRLRAGKGRDPNTVRL